MKRLTKTILAVATVASGYGANEMTAKTFIVDIPEAYSSGKFTHHMKNRGYKVIKEMKYRRALVVKGTHLGTMSLMNKPVLGKTLKPEARYKAISSCTRKRPGPEPPAEQPAQVKPDPVNGLWGVWRIQAPQAWEHAKGEGIKVCVVDSGVDIDHPDLAENILEGEGFVGISGDYQDDNGHGTHVSGTILAANNSIGVVGVSPRSQLISAKVLDQSGSGTTSGVADGILYCVSAGAHIINLSLGSPDPDPVVRDALKVAKEKGVYIFCASGNDSSQTGYPAAHPECEAINSLAQGDQMAYYSNFGPLTAYILPGSDVLSTVPNDNYDTFDGTSMATPHMAGLMALILSAGKTEVKSIDLGLPTEEQGAGLPNALLSVK